MVPYSAVAAASTRAGAELAAVATIAAAAAALHRGRAALGGRGAGAATARGTRGAAALLILVVHGVGSWAGQACVWGRFSPASIRLTHDLAGSYTARTHFTCARERSEPPIRKDESRR